MRPISVTGIIALVGVVILAIVVVMMAKQAKKQEKRIADLEEKTKVLNSKDGSNILEGLVTALVKGATTPTAG